MNQRDAPAASFCRKSTALSAACSDDTGMAAAACSSGSIPNVISSRKYEAVPEAKTRNSPQQVSRPDQARSEEHTSELQTLMRTSYAVFCLNQKTKLQ